MIAGGLLVLAVLLHCASADIIWVDHFDDLGSPGTDQPWFDPWPTWNSEGIPYFSGTTTTFEEEGYHCGAACGTPADSSEYSFFGRFMSPSMNGVDLIVVSTGIQFGSSSSYSFWLDLESNSAAVSDFVEGVGNHIAGIAEFVLQSDTWYRYRLEQDLSEMSPWVRAKLWQNGQPEPVHWTVEGAGLGFHPGQMILIHGFDTTSLGSVHFDDVGVESQIAPRRIIDLAASLVGADLALDWTPASTADSTSLYQGLEPYFQLVPGTETTGIIGGSTLLGGLLGDPDIHHFFIVRAVNENGEGPPSPQVGEFEFELSVP